MLAVTGPIPYFIQGLFMPCLGCYSGRTVCDSIRVKNDMSGDLQLNKIFGAVLATGLVVMGVGIFSQNLFHTEAPKKMGYAIEVAESGEGGGAAAAADVLPDWGTVLATADLAAGEAVFKKCASCHSVAQGGGHMTGPNLWGVMGRAPGSAAGFGYSDAMKAHAADAPVWGYDAMYAFLGAPAKVVKGTKMSFAGVKKSEDRVNLIAYLRSQGSGGFAIPAADPSRQPGAAAAPAADAAATSEAAPTDAAKTAAAPAKPAAKPAEVPAPAAKPAEAPAAH